ncbi:MAG: DUF2207 domain-containing protein [Anaerolineae bacterium]|nr:DUF2207 domain-containing protein [Anaerolineae bacterium]
MNHHKLLRFTVLLFVLAAVLLAPVATLVPEASAQAKSFYWERFDVDIQVLENGDLIVTENQTLTFSGGTFSAGFRTIPTGSAGNNDGIDRVEVTEGDVRYTENRSEQPHTFYVQRYGDTTEINWFFAPALGSQRYTIRYRVRGAVRTEESGDQVFWNAMPADLGSHVSAGRVTITLPEGIEAAASTALLGGRETGSVVTETSADGRRVTFDLNQGRPAGSDFEVGVRFPSGQLALETASWQQAEQVADVASLIILLFALLITIGGPIGAVLLWYLRGRDPDPGVVPEYLAQPPGDLPPAVVGTLVDETAHIHDVMSTLVDLARRGYLTMEQTGSSGDDFTFHRTDKPVADLRPFERTMIEKLFKGKKTRSLDSLRYSFAQHLPAIRSQLYEELVSEGLTASSPEGVRQRYGCLAFLVGGVGIISAFALPSLFGGISTVVCPAIGLVLTAVVLFGFSRVMPAKTEAGAVAAAKWLAFKRYLRDIEKYSDLQEARDIFEQYLAYAVAFGLERSWIRKFSSIPGVPIPPWYQPHPRYGGYGGGPIFFPGGGRQGSSGSGGRPGGGMPDLESMSGGLTGGLEAMSGGLTRMLNSTQSVLQSTRPSSSSSGSRSFGGGFSGGFSGGSSGGGGGGFR